MNTTHRPAPSPASARYVGRAVYIYAFDVAYEMKREPIGLLLGQTVANFRIDAGKRTPRQPFFYRPQMIQLPPEERIGPQGPVRVERTVKLFHVGAISIAASVPFAVNDLSELVAFHNLQFTNGSLDQEVRELAEQVRTELTPYCIRPVAALAEGEAYTVFCLHSPLRGPGGGPVESETWLADNRRQIAALLTEEYDAEHLSVQEAEESTSLYLTYYEHDLAVVDWDAALVADDPANFNEVLHFMELANVQLAELGAYDLLLDAALDRSYRDLKGARFRWHREPVRGLREIRLDMARLSDELSNTTKFFGDWHLARLYQNLSQRFHLADWHRVIGEKLRAIDGLYEVLKHDQTNWWMILLEGTIVLLFIIDVILLLAGLA
ncbi:MAG TPA: hypothetical protein PK082_06490 [Phycisphaerae bacterium]|nr:hypothetical protein [Phycisphaerae bacterium]